MLVMHNPAFAEEAIDHYVALGTVNNIANTLFPPIEILDRIAVIFQKVGIFKYMSLTNAQRNLVAKFCKTSPGVCGKAFEKVRNYGFTIHNLENNSSLTGDRQRAFLISGYFRIRSFRMRNRNCTEGLTGGYFE